MAGASVLVPGAAPARTDSVGVFCIRTATPGALIVRVTAVGYAAQVRTRTPVTRTGLAFRLLPVSAQVLAPVAVRGDRETANSPVAGYLARRSATGLRLDVPLHDTPVSVQVVPRDVLVDHAALSVDEAVENVSGVRVVESLAYRNVYQVRGFAVRGSTLRDVVRDRNRITGGGTTAGIDFGLTLAALLKGEEVARRIQLTIEYAHDPPFKNGTPAEAGPVRVAQARARRTWMDTQARAASERAGARLA